jgi:hypothetical protein
MQIHNLNVLFHKSYETYGGMSKSKHLSLQTTEEPSPRRPGLFIVHSITILNVFILLLPANLVAYRPAGRLPCLGIAFFSFLNSIAPPHLATASQTSAEMSIWSICVPFVYFTCLISPCLNHEWHQLKSLSNRVSLHVQHVVSIFFWNKRSIKRNDTWKCSILARPPRANQSH